MRLVAERSVSSGKDDDETDNDLYSKERVTSMVGHSFPDFIEHWNRMNFRRVGYGLSATTALAAAGSVVVDGGSFLAPAAILGILTAGYWHVGLKDIRQTSHAIRRNYPVLGNMRYLLETVRV
jgi:hypothetical protein